LVGIELILMPLGSAIVVGGEEDDEVALIVGL
jgi:hypothetical protein